MASADMEFDAFEDAGSLGSAYVGRRSQEGCGGRGGCSGGVTKGEMPEEGGEYRLLSREALEGWVRMERVV